MHAFPNSWISLSSLFLGFMVVVLAMPLLNRLAHHSGWLDHPTTRKAHEGAIPLTGGLAILLALAAHGIVFRDWPMHTAGLAIGLVLCFLVGFLDDRFPLRARHRFAVQFLAAASAVFLGNTVLVSLGHTFGAFELNLWIFALPVTLVCFAGAINACNMSDGLDGLCGGYILAALFWLGVCASLIEISNPAHLAWRETAPVVLPVAGAVAAFLIFHNLRTPWRQRANAFLGDSGSMALGFLVTWLAVRLASGYGEASIPPVTALWILAMPLIDLFSSVMRRVMEGQKPLTADRRHLHHMLQREGLSVATTVTLLHALAFGGGAIGVIGWQLDWPEPLMFWGLFALLIAHTLRSVAYWREADLLAQLSPAGSASSHGEAPLGQ